MPNTLTHDELQSVLAEWNARGDETVTMSDDAALEIAGQPLSYIMKTLEKLLAEKLCTSRSLAEAAQ